MKATKARKIATAPAPQPSQAPVWPYAAAALAALVAAFWAYGPALNGPFLFDDQALPFALPNFQAPLINWLKADVRPVLFFTYYLNAQIGDGNPYSFHVVNVLIHLVSTGLIFLIVRRLLEWRRREAGPQRITPKDRTDDFLAGLAAAIFLVHPVQTEAVAYLAGRSESLSAMFGLAALAVFVYRKQATVTWAVAAAVLALFGLALLSKQNAIALPALLLLTDYWWNPGFTFQGIRANWRLYVPTLLGALVGTGFFWKLIMTAETAGFGMKDLTWYQYFFTQCRALFVYLGLFVLPANLTADWDFSISRSILDHGAIAGLIVLVTLAAAAWHYRRRFPLASFGFFVFLVMMAPTSSILPIRDPIAERRLYSAILGLLLIAVDLLGRVKLERKVLVAASAAVVLLLTVVTHARAAVWSDSLALWEDTARKAPNKRRVRFQLGYAYFSLEPPDYQRAIAEFEKAGQLEPPDYNLLVDEGLAYDGLNRIDDALAKLRLAAMKGPTAHVYTQIGMVYAKRQRWPQALDALATAEKIDAGFGPTYMYRGKVYELTGRFAEARTEYEHALRIDPVDKEARDGLLRVMQLLQQRPAN
ncbi:MAG TPA: tetratricopeptide repeat protein [Bryobacteraceae bacterium]|nr:tetratricopeptide repeat protein [Bryobacteraceae bacterium]